MRILSTLAVKGVLVELSPAFEQAAGVVLDVVLEPTALLMERARSGERADVALLTSDGIDALSREGILDGASKVDVAVSEVGIAVRQGAAKPDISTPEAVRALLLRVPTLCYSKAGASGMFFAKVIRQLGIAEEVERKATIIPSGFTAELVAAGKAEIAVQQVSELMVVPGVDIVGPLPHPLQETLTFSGAVFLGSQDAANAAALLQFLTRPDLATTYRRNGLIPAAG